MFEGQVKCPVRLRSFALLGTGLLGAGLLALVWSQPAKPEVAEAIAPPVAVEAPLPVVVEAAPEPPAPPAVEPEPEPVIGTTCVADVSNVGAPLGEPLNYDRRLEGTAIDPDGCGIAAWTKDELFVSWDGG